MDRPATTARPARRRLRLFTPTARSAASWQARADKPVRIAQLALLFGVIYFVQGMGDPTTGLVSQPDEALLRQWGETANNVALFGALLSLPWCLKPLFALLSDVVPLRGSHRKNYLLIASALAAVGFLWLHLMPVQVGAERRLLSWLTLATVGVIFGDVVIDGLMIETGQPLGLTGRLQSVQWAAIYAGTILTGIFGGVLSQHHEQKLGFLLCSAMMVATFVLTWLFVVEPPRRDPAVSWRSAVPSLRALVGSRGFLAVGLFMFLWNFNLFCQPVLYLHTTGALGFADELFGDMVAIGAAGSMLACLAYACYCRRVAMRWLLHLAIVAGIVSNLAYLLLGSHVNALALSAFVGFTYMTASMVQADLAARACTERMTSTVFATFMALCNMASAASTWLGGVWYHHAAARWGTTASFQSLIVVSSVFTMTCWLVVRSIPAHLLTVSAPAAESGATAHNPDRPDSESGTTEGGSPLADAPRRAAA